MIVPASPQLPGATAFSRSPTIDGQESQQDFASLLTDPAGALPADGLPRALIEPSTPTNKDALDTPDTVAFGSRGMFGQSGPIDFSEAPIREQAVPDAVAGREGLAAASFARAAAEIGPAPSAPAVVPHSGQSAAPPGIAVDQPHVSVLPRTQAAPPSHPTTLPSEQGEPTEGAGVQRRRAILPNRGLSVRTEASAASLTVAEAVGGLTVVMRGADAADRARLRAMADRVATRLGLAIGNLVIDGVSQPRTPIGFGERHGD